MPHIDTLAVARRLEQSGLPLEQARALAEVIADVVRDSQPDLSSLAAKDDLTHLATKEDLKDLELRIMDKLRSQMIWFYSVQAAFLGIGVTLFKLLSK